MRDISPFKQIPIIEIAKRLGIKVLGTKAMCFTGHDSKTPSLTFNKSKNTWKCYGACGKYGDQINLVAEVCKLEFKDAIEWLSREFVILVPWEQSRSPRKKRRLKPAILPPAPKIQESKEFAADPELYEWLIIKCGHVSKPQGVEYLNSHGIPPEIAADFGVRELCNPNLALIRLIEKWGAQRVYRSGIAWGNNGRPERIIWTSYALLFPFYEQQSVVFIQGRLFEGNKKYLNPRGIAKPLFNTNALMKLEAGKRVHICEGVPDAIALESQNLVAVGVPGATSFRPEWVDYFLKFNVDVMGDNDAGGRKFHKEVSKCFAERGMAVRCVPISEGKDVAEVIAKIRRLK